MSDITLVTSSADLERRMWEAVGDSLLTLRQAVLPVDPVHLFARLPDDAGVDVIVLDCTAESDAGLELAHRLHEQCPSSNVVLVSDRAAELALAALRAGVTDIVEPTADIEELRQVLARAAKSAQTRRVDSHSPVNGAAVPAMATEVKPMGRVISVVSPKGGVGKTTVATNIAVGLAKFAPRATVLVDLDIQFGDVASGLNLDPEYYLPSVVHGPASRDTMVLKTFLTLHETGLYVVCAPESPAAADTVSAADVGRLLRTLAGDFRYVVVDTAPGLSEHTLAAMDESTDLVLLTSMDVPGLRGMRKELDTLAELGMNSLNRHLVLNFSDPRVGLSTKDIETTIGTSVDVMLPRSKAAPTSVNLGVPLLQSGTRDPMTKQLRALVSRFVDEAAAEQVAKLPRFDRGKKDRPTPRRAASGWFRRPRVASTS